MKNLNKKYIIVAAAALLLLVLVLLLRNQDRADPLQTVPMTSETEPMTIQQQPIELEQGLRILRIDRYSGIFLEDGTDEMVTDVLMVVLENRAEQDLQLARVTLDYGNQKAEFEVTNLPAGERVVALERSRMAFVEEELCTASAQNIVFFQERMDLAENRIKLEGKTGMIRITNQSGEDLPGPVCIYYKNRHDELYYGGITYRITIAEGLTAGEQITMPAGHYDPERSVFVMADFPE